ncbi:uncharacterized protein LOC103988769 [Musa acuminata AAA Group]|uniref:uncharacterized protein LOC103988769 n=1 Tax=Musa acuminata AAA Group TaxID=214697 RepID=UPI0031E3D3AD
MDGEGEEEHLVEEREVEMVAFTGPRKPVYRKGWFLRPLGVPFFPPRRKRPSFVDLDDSMVVFNGWASVSPKWNQWVDKLRPIYGGLWKKVGIFDAIHASTYRIRRDSSSILAISASWCGDTSTFIFPWAEVTVTLEDVMILGGFPVAGEPIRGPLHGELKEIEVQMTAERKSFSRSPSKRPNHNQWMMRYMECEGDELEHIAFLALWLSRFVFPAHAFKTVTQSVLPVAIRLARGARIALAPAVLASLYRDLGKVKDYLADRGRQKVSSLVIWAPFNLLQLWIWEHFVALRPAGLNEVNDCEPRAARWHNVGKKLKLALLRSVLESPNEFQWRPYTVGLRNWHKPCFYKDKGLWIHSVETPGVELKSFAQFLRRSELVGLDCIEQYSPQRVAMQFGLDQDIPGSVVRTNLTWEAAWETYDISRKNIVFYIPPQLFESDVTLQYSVSWKQKIRPRATGTISSVEQPNSSLKSAKVIAGKVRGVKKMKSVQVLTFGKKRTVQECYDSDTTLSHWFACNDNQESRENKCIKTQKHSLTSSEKQMRPIREQKSNKMPKLSQKFPKDIKQNSSTQWQSKRKQAKEASSTDRLDEEKQLKRRTAGEYACKQMLIKNSREALQPAQSEFSIELTEVTKQEENSTKGKQSKIHVKFKMLKHENTEGKEDEVLLTEVTETEDVPKINLKEENSQEKEVEGKNAGEQQVKNLNNENAEDEEDKTFVDKVDNENVGEMQIKMLKKQNSADKNDKEIIRNDYRDSGESFFDQILKMVPENTLPLEQEEKLKQRRGKKFSPKAEESVHEMEIKELKKEIAAIEARVMALESLAEVHT